MRARESTHTYMHSNILKSTRMHTDHKNTLSNTYTSYKNIDTSEIQTLYHLGTLWMYKVKNVSVCIDFAFFEMKSSSADILFD